MTNKQPGGQTTRRYRYETGSLREHRRMQQQRRLEARRQTGEMRREEALTPRSPGRRVTMPREAVQPPSWSERRARLRQPTGEQPGREHRMVQRTLAQTGRPAPVGRMRMSRPLPRSGRIAASPVPARSKQARRGWRFWRRVLGFFAVVAVVGGGISFALMSPTFHIQHINITGTQNAGLITNIRHMGMQGQDIFLLNSSLIVTHLETSPLVASASVDTALPNQVTVTIQERAPVLLWQSGRVTYGVGQDGVVIAPQSELSGTSKLGLVIDQRPATKLHAGSRLNAADIAFVRQVFAQVPGIEGAAPFTLHYVMNITEGTQTEPANLAGSGSYVLASASGWQAYLGDAQNSASLTQRLQDLREILSMAQQQNLQLATIDLRFGSRLIYTLKA